MYVGAGLWSCGDAPSTAEIWGSDSRLVFLLHNQFAVWIPLHITLNTHTLLDPAKSLSSFLPPPISLHVFFTGLHLCFTFKNLKMPNLYHCKQLPHEAVQNSFLLCLFFYQPLQNVHFPCFLLQNACLFPIATVDSAPTAFSGNAGD